MRASLKQAGGQVRIRRRSKLAPILALGVLVLVLAAAGFLSFTYVDDAFPKKMLADFVMPTFPDSLQGVDIGLQGLEHEIFIEEATNIDVIRQQLKSQTTEAVDIDPPPPGVLLVDDFDKDGATEREWICPVGGWVNDPTDPTIRCIEAYDPLIRYGNKGYSLKLWYDLESPNPAFGGLWMQFRYGGSSTLDLSTYKTLVLLIKGTSTPLGFTTRLKLEIKNKEEASSVILDGITQQWKRFEIPLSSFKDISDWTRMTELVIVLEPEVITDKEGILYFDEVQFVK